MKNFKRTFAMLMALSMLSTMGVSAYADDTQRVDVDETINDDWGRVTLTGEVTSVEDGKVTVMFDGNYTFELDNISANVGDTVIATAYGDAIDEEWFEYAEITVVAKDTTTDDKQLYISGDANLDGKLNVVDVMLTKKAILHTTEPNYIYADGDEIKLVESENVGEEVTINATGYQIDLDNQTIEINGVDGKLQELTLQFTDSTEYNGEFTNLSELANMVISCETYPLQSDPNLAIAYDTATNEVLQCYQIEYSYQQPLIQTTYSTSVSFGDNSLSIAEGDPIQYMVTDDTAITLYTDTEETITFEELKEAYQTADGYMKLEINYYYNETSQQYEVSSIKAYYIN